MKSNLYKLILLKPKIQDANYTIRDKYRLYRENIKTEYV